MSSDKQKILILGHNGFVGAALCKKLKESSAYEVLTDEKGVSWLSSKIPDADIIVNCAGVLKDENRMISDNVIYPLQVANLCEKFNKRLIHLGSFRETHGCTTFYAKTKKAASDLILAIPNLHVTIIRPATIYGPGEQAHSLFHKFWSGRKGIELKFTRDTREYIYIDDMVSFIMVVLSHPYIQKELYASGGQYVSNYDLFNLFQNITQSKNIKYHFYTTYQTVIGRIPKNDNFDILWTPKVSLADGMARWINWKFEQENKAKFNPIAKQS